MKQNCSASGDSFGERRNGRGGVERLMFKTVDSWKKAEVMKERKS